MRRRGLRHGLAALAAVVLTAPAAQAETLSDALIMAYRNSGLLEQNRALLRAADEDVAQAVAQLRPVLNYVANVDYTRPVNALQDNLSFGIGLTSEILIHDSGATRYAIDAAKEAVLGARESLRGVEQDVLYQAVSAYMEVRRAVAFVDLAQGSVDVIAEELGAARDRFEVGEVTRTDVSNAEAQYAGAQATLAAALGDLEQAREEYRVATGQYPDQLAPPPAPPALPESVERALDIARQNHPAINSAQRDVSAAEFNILQASAAMGPSLSASASVNFDEELEDQASIGLNFGGPLYRGGSLSSLLRQAQANRDAARGALHTTVRQVEQSVGNAWALYIVSGSSIEANRSQVEAQELALEGTQDEAQLGALTTLDVLNAEQELLDARSSLVASEIDRYVATYGILRAMGQLSVESLNLGIATYDASSYYEAVRDAPTREVSPRGERLDSVMKRLGGN